MFTSHSSKMKHLDQPLCFISEYHAIGQRTPTVVQTVQHATDGAEQILLRLTYQWNQGYVQNRMDSNVGHNGYQAMKSALACFRLDSQLMPLTLFNRLIDNLTGQYRFKTTSGRDLAMLTLEPFTKSENVMINLDTAILQSISPIIRDMVMEAVTNDEYKRFHDNEEVNEDTILSDAETEICDPSDEIYEMVIDDSRGPICMSKQTKWPNADAPIHNLSLPKRYVQTLLTDFY